MILNNEKKVWFFLEISDYQDYDGRIKINGFTIEAPSDIV